MLKLFEKHRALQWLWIAIIIIGLDQYSKLLALQHLSYAQPKPILPGFNLTLAYNTGSAFSFLKDAGGWQKWLFVVFTSSVIIGILGWLWKMSKQQTLLAISLVLILGGGIGNLYDRLTLGYVIDFIQVYYKQWSWPVFNIADSAVCVGAGLFLIDTFLHRNNNKVS